MVLVAIPAAANPLLFNEIHKKQTVRIVLPDDQCEAKVVKRDLDHLTVRLKVKKTGPDCVRQSRSLVLVSRSDIKDVVDERHSTESFRGACTTLVTALAAPTAVAVGMWTGNGVAMMFTAAGGGVTAGILCHQATRYTVFVERIVPARP
jgi:hypothetical protein